uniref:Uncharacterized protein n=1 Tax=Strongyloides venezuelensis TaxID=75913 RepID=A0A0K0EYK6_STRVS
MKNTDVLDYESLFPNITINFRCLKQLETREEIRANVHETNKVAENLNKLLMSLEFKFSSISKTLASYLARQFIDYFAEFDFISSAIFLDKMDPVEMIQVDPSQKLQIFDLLSDKSISNVY